MNKLSSADVTLDEVITTTGNAVRVSPLSYLEASTPGTGGFLETGHQRLGVQRVLPITTPQELDQVSLEGPAGKQVFGDVPLSRVHSGYGRALPPVAGKARRVFAAASAIALAGLALAPQLPTGRQTVPLLPDKTLVAQKKNRAHKPDVAGGGSLGQSRGAGGVWGREPRAPGSRGPPAVGPVQCRSRRAGWSISSRGCVPVLIQHLSRP